MRATDQGVIAQAHHGGRVDAVEQEQRFIGFERRRLVVLYDGRPHAPTPPD
jgi:hypothetical protein